MGTYFTPQKIFLYYTCYSFEDLVGRKVPRTYMTTPYYYTHANLKTKIYYCFYISIPQY